MAEHLPVGPIAPEGLDVDGGYQEARALPVLATNDAIFTVPGGRYYRLREITFGWQTSATAGDRFAQVAITYPSPIGAETNTVIFRYPAGRSQPASRSFRYTFSRQATNAVIAEALGASNLIYLLSPLPDLLLPPTTQIEVLIDGAAAGDLFAVEPIGIFEVYPHYGAGKLAEARARRGLGDTLRDILRL